MLLTLFGDSNLKIATYNVENLFDLKKDGYEYKEYIPNNFSNWNRKNQHIKIVNIAKVIKGIDADIIAIEEIESKEVLKSLRQELKKQGLYYKYYKIADKKNTTVKVALLSKISFIYAKEISVTSSYKYRNILEVKFKIKGQYLYLFVNHWKAKSGAESKRIISAKVLKNRIDEIGIDKNIILLGDFNSDYEEYIKFKRKRRLNDTGGKTGINHILRSIKQTRKVSKTKLKEGNFYNLWYDVNVKDRYTYVFRGKKEALDNILISQSLLKKKGIFYKERTLEIYKPKYLIKRNKPFRWQMTRKKPHKHKGKGYSDHFAIFASFIIKD